MIVVEQGALGAFEQDAGAGAALLVEQAPGDVLVRQDEVGDGHQLVVDGLRRDLRLAETPAQRIMVRQQPLDPVHKRFRMGEVVEADGAPADLVFIGRADTLAGSSYFGVSFGCFIGSIQNAVCRKNQMSFL